MSKAFKKREFLISELSQSGDTVNEVTLRGRKAEKYILERVREVPKNAPNLWRFLLAIHLSKGEHRIFTCHKNSQYKVVRVS